jgi:hypothetical protein
MSKRLPGIQDGERTVEEIDMARFVKLGRGMQEVLQEVENALVQAGYDDFRRVDRARLVSRDPTPEAGHRIAGRALSLRSL